MANPPVPNTAISASPALSPPGDAPIKQIRVISHCTLFYWWPVWAIGFILVAFTYFTNQRMVLVDRGAHYYPKATVTADGRETAEGKIPDIVDVKRAAWVLPEGKKIPHEEMLRISPNKNIGVLFSIVLVLVIAITNIPLRGLWSVIVLVLIVALSIIFALLDWWTPILNFFTILDIRINLEGYLLISTVLFVLWLLVFIFFDRQIYMIFTPGRLVVREEIGDAETAYDTTGMTIQKKRSDLFRHWVLGLGSGDLIVKTAGAHSHEIEFSNVLFVGRKVRQIEMMVSSREVVVSQD